MEDNYKLLLGIIIGFVLAFLVFIMIDNKKEDNKKCDCEIEQDIMPNENSVYIERCSTTEKHPVASDRKEKMKEFLSNYSKIELTEFEVKCNLIDIVLIVDDSLEYKELQDISNKMLDIFTTDELEYYDIELMVASNNKNSSVYPVMGTHHKNDTKGFVW